VTNPLHREAELQVGKRKTGRRTAHTSSQPMIAMSSFLMNSGTSYVVDPKFPPSEEYSQSSYIPVVAASTATTGQDVYYGGNVPHHHHQVHHHGYGGYHQQQHQPQQHYVHHQVNGHHQHHQGYYGQHPSHGTTTTTGGGGYYGAPCGGMTPVTGHVAPVHHHQESPLLITQQQTRTSPVNSSGSPTPSLTNFSQHQIDPMGGQQHLIQQQQQQLHMNSVHDQLAHLGSMVAQQPPVSVVPSPEMAGGGNNNSVLCSQHQPPTPSSPDDAESDLMDEGVSDEELSDDSHNPVIYPWMKKIHVAGTRKFCKYTFFYLLFLIICV